jgi:hypothetical protein
MNRSLKSIALLFCLGAMMSSCSHKVEPVVPDSQPIYPLADFTWNPDALDGFTFKFTNASTKATKLEMRFGDDSVATSADVSHTYVNTGDPAKQFKYTVDLKAVSSTGDISHKYLDIAINPDSIITLNAVKTSTTATRGTVLLSATVKGIVKSYTWTITDNSAITPVTKTFTTATASSDYLIGSFNSVTLTIVTTKGSTATLTRNFTVDGIATNITASYINNTPLYPAAITNNENTAQGVNEGASKLVDGNITTKYGYYSAFAVKPMTISLQFPAPVLVKSYGLCNGNDSDVQRDPMEWYVDGANSKDGPWIELDHQNLTKGFYDQGTALGLSGNNPATGKDIRYMKWFYYPLTTTGFYTWYRWRVVGVNGPRIGKGEAFQMSEIAFFK